jgi:Peptidase A4 family
MHRFLRLFASSPGLKSAVLREGKMDTTPNFRTFKLPPPGFDIQQASDRELLLYGLPLRPNPTSHPTLAARWSRIAAQRHEFITPELRPLPIRRQVDPGFIERRAIRESEVARYIAKENERSRGNLILDPPTGPPKRGLGSMPIILPQTSTFWSGAYVPRPASEPIENVYGEWTVTGVNPPTQPDGTYQDGTYQCAFWVGIDGTSGSADVLQAGTTSQCVVSGGNVTSTSVFVWTEWYSAPWQPQNFAVTWGDQIACSVCAPVDNTHGIALFNNMTTGQIVTFGIVPPTTTPPTSLLGNVAEWIVEDPQQLSGAPYLFPVYGGTTFTGCTAGTKNIEIGLYDDGTEIDMVQGVKTLSTGIIEGNHTVFCHYGPPP